MKSFKLTINLYFFLLIIFFFCVVLVGERRSLSRIKKKVCISLKNDFTRAKSSLETKLSRTQNMEERNTLFASFGLKLHKLHRIIMSYQLLNTDVGIPFLLDHHVSVLEYFPEERDLVDYTPEGRAWWLLGKVGRYCFMEGKDSNQRRQELLSSVKVIVSTLPEGSVVKRGEM